MSPRPPLILAGGVLIAIFWGMMVSSVFAQVFQLGTWGGSLEGTAGINRQKNTSGDSQGSTFERRKTEEVLRLRNIGGYIWDPRFMTTSLGGTIGLYQEKRTTDGTHETPSGTLTGYDLFTSILPGKLTSLNLFTNRTDSSESRELAGQTDTVNENVGGTLFMRGIYIPSSLSWISEHREDRSRTGDIVSRREDRRNTLTYEGQRGWLNREMDVRYEYIDLADKVLPSLSYKSHEANFDYSQDFGEELNRHWDSQVRYFKRSGLSDLETWNVNEFLRIEHYENLQTGYQYLFSRTASAGNETDTHTGGFSLTHRLYESLTSTARLNGTYQTLPEGKKQIYDGRLDFNYNKNLPRNGRLNAALGGGLKYQRDRFKESAATVLQENHTAESPFALPIQLDNLFVVASSIVVTKVEKGPLPVGCLPTSGPPLELVPGRDYSLRTSGGITEIVPISCSGTTPGINPGDVIAVDYRYTVAPSRTFTTTSWRNYISVDYQWIRPYFIHEQTDESLISGRADDFLENRTLDTLGVEFRYNGERLQGNLLAEAQRQKSTRQSFDLVRSRQSLGFYFTDRLRLGMHASQSHTKFTKPQNETRTTMSAGGTLTYAANSTLFADAFVRMDYIKDSLAPTERDYEAGVSVRWYFRKVEVNPVFKYNRHQSGSNVTDEYEGLVRIVRRF